MVRNVSADPCLKAWHRPPLYHKLRSRQAYGPFLHTEARHRRGYMRISAGLADPAILATAATALAATVFVTMARRKPAKTYTQVQPTSFNKGVLSRIPSLTSGYSKFLIAGGHVETIFAAWFRRNPPVEYDRELLQTPDGGSVALDYHRLPPNRDLLEDAPVVILLPGLTGGSHDSYVRHMVGAASQYGFRSVVFNSRGTSDQPVTSPQFYSASFTGDMRQVVQVVQKRYPKAELLAVGWSLGANILVRYLGEEKDNCPISAAASLCNPFNLAISDANLGEGFNKVYNRNLAKSLRNIYKQHSHLFAGIGGDYQPELAAQCTTIREFDDAITRVSFGWPSVDAYYQGSGSYLMIPHVHVPLLCVQAEDDPIAPARAIPYEALQQNPNCILTVTPTGGHLGWVAGPEAPLGAPWSTRVVAEWLISVQLELLRSGRSKRFQQQLSQYAQQESPDSVTLQHDNNSSNGNGSSHVNSGNGASNETASAVHG